MRSQEFDKAGDVMDRLLSSYRKEYGRLIILSEDKLKEVQHKLDFSCQKWISEVDLSNAIVAIIEGDVIEAIKNKEESEE